MGVKEINSYDEFKQIINSGRVVAIHFWATFSSPCTVISPVFEQLSEKATGVEFYKVNIAAQVEISQEVGIQAPPTFIVFKDGNKMDTLIGAHREKLEHLVTIAEQLNE